MILSLLAVLTLVPQANAAPIGSDLISLSVEALSNEYGLACETTAPKINCHPDQEGNATKCLLKQETLCESSNRSIFPKKSVLKIKAFYATRTYAESGEFRIQKIKLSTKGPAFPVGENEIFGSAFENETLNFLGRARFDCDTSTDWKAKLNLVWTRKLNCTHQADPVSPKTSLKVRLLRTRSRLRTIRFKYEDEPGQD